MPSKRHLTKGDNTVSGTVVIKKSVFHANEDGTTETKVIGVNYHTESDVFEIELPKHLAEYRTGPGNNTLLQLRDSTAAQVVAKYEAISETYSRWRLSLNGQRLLWVGTHAKVSDFAKSVFGIDSSVALGIKVVSRYTDKTHGDAIVAIDDEGNPRGDVTPVALANPILIPDTPENRAKVQSLIDSIATAAAVIEGARNAADPAAYIQAINDRWSVEPVQPDLFTGSGVAAEEKAAAQTPVDDEEL